MIEASRSILNRYVPDIYLYSDVYKGDESGKYETPLTHLVFHSRGVLGPQDMP